MLPSPAQVVVADILDQGEVVRNIMGLGEGHEVLAVKCDVRDRQSVDSAVGDCVVPPDWQGGRGGAAAWEDRRHGRPAFKRMLCCRWPRRRRIGVAWTLWWPMQVWRGVCCGAALAMLHPVTPAVHLKRFAAWQKGCICMRLAYMKPSLLAVGSRPHRCKHAHRRRPRPWCSSPDSCHCCCR